MFPFVSSSDLIRPCFDPATKKSFLRRVPFETIKVATTPLPVVTDDSITVPIESLFGLPFNSSSSDCNKMAVNNSSIPSPLSPEP